MKNSNRKSNQYNGGTNIATLYAIVGIVVVVGIVIVSILSSIFESRSWMILLTTLAGN